MIASASLRFGMVGAGGITQAFRGQIENFTRAIRGEDKLLVSPEDALASVEVIETVYDSLHHSVWQSVKHKAWRPKTFGTIIAIYGQLTLSIRYLLLPVSQKSFPSPRERGLSSRVGEDASRQIFWDG